MDVVRIVRLVFGVVGVGLLAGAVLGVQSTRSFLADSVSARGTVLGLVARTSTDSDGHTSTTFAPQVQFTTADGRSVTFISSTSSYPPAQEPGDAVEVLYRANDPSDARIHDWFSLWGFPAILGGLGTVFTGLAAAFTLTAWRDRRRVPRAVVPVLDAGDDPEEPDEDAEDDEDAGDAGDADDEGSGATSDPGLRGHGVRVRADVQHVRPTGTYAASGSATYCVVAQWLDPDRHEVRVFTSEPVPFDPTPYLEDRTLDVWIDPDDAGRHWVDLSFLPRAAG